MKEWTRSARTAAILPLNTTRTGLSSQNQEISLQEEITGQWPAMKKERRHPIPGEQSIHLHSYAGTGHESNNLHQSFPRIPNILYNLLAPAYRSTRSSSVNWYNSVPISPLTRYFSSSGAYLSKSLVPIYEPTILPISSLSGSIQPSRTILRSPSR